jgi:DNA-binding XRE family transcriptional regulator
MSTILREKRVAAGLSQSALAVIAGVRSSSLCRIERGERCNQQTAMRLAAALQQPVREVFPDFDHLRDF